MDFLGHLLGLAEFEVGQGDSSYCSSLSRAPVRGSEGTGGRVEAPGKGPGLRAQAKLGLEEDF